MTEDIILSIKGLQMLTGGDDQHQDEPVEVITKASYKEIKGKHYIKYNEVVEGQSGMVENLIKINEDSLEVTKRGLVNVHMIFEQNKKNVTYYDTPFGNLLVGIAATNIDFEMNADKNEMNMTVDYVLDINYEHMADCTIQMAVQSADNKKPGLLS